MPLKFAIGMVLWSFSFLVFPVAAKFANEAFRVQAGWVFTSYALLSAGELMISGLGLAMVTHLVPRRLLGFIMGAWYLTSSCAAVISAYIAGLTAVPRDIHIDPHHTLTVYSHVYMEIGIATGIIAIVMLATASLLHRMTLATDKESNCSLTINGSQRFLLTAIEY